MKNISEPSEVKLTSFNSDLQVTYHKVHDVDAYLLITTKYPMGKYKKAAIAKYYFSAMDLVTYQILN